MPGPAGLFSGVRVLAVPFLILFSLSLPGRSATSLTELQQNRDFIAAKKQIADYLPDLAIPRITQLLDLPDLAPPARQSLLTLLGEAQVRAGRPGEALTTLDHPTLRDFSPAHLWRSYALTGLGRYRDAIGELARIDRPTMRPSADLQAAKLYLALGQTEKAAPLLENLRDSPDPALAKEATLQLISLALTEDRPDDAAELLDSFQPADPVEEGLVRYLTGRLQLARGERLAAVGTFQTLLNDPESRKTLSAPLFHQSSLALAKSLALGGNEEAAVASLLETLEKNPDSPRIDDLFAHLRTWAGKIDPDPIRQKLATWIPALPSPPPFPLIPATRSALSPLSADALPVPTRRQLLALEFLATINLRSDNPAFQAEGRLQLSLLQLLAPADSPAVGRGLLALGLVEMGTENFSQALALFSLLKEFQLNPRIRAYARALAGKAAAALERPTEASRFYLEAEEIAREIREEELASLAALNAGITLLAASRSRELDEITRNLASAEARALLILERGLYLSAKSDPAARDLLARFLSQSPGNPRAPEAALALAENATFTPPFDRDLARTSILPLQFDPESQPLLEARRILVLLALDLNTRQAHDFLTRSPDNPLADRVLFQLGQSYRAPARQADRDIGKANLQFELLLDQYPESPFAEAARYYSALTSIALKTESADESALGRLRELIAAEGTLANEAAINLCSFLIDRDRQAEALEEITTFLRDPDLPAADRRRFFILGAEAALQSGRYPEALAFHRDLLAMPDLPVATRNRASYLRGQTLEKLGRTAEALQAYNEVVNRNFDPEGTTSLEWKWFDKCGIEGALALLRKEERWEAAIRLAEKIGASGSPRAEDAREIADRIALEHFIYRERPAPTSADLDPEPGPDEDD